MARGPTNAELVKQVAKLQMQLEATQTANAERNSQVTALIELQDTLTAQLHDAEARVETAQAEAVAANAAAEAAAAAAATATAAAATAAENNAAAANVPAQLIPKPSAHKFNIREEMGVTDAEYGAIRATIHTLVKSTQLAWKDDFRHQDPASLALLFKTARKEHPILRNYANNWATAAIVKTYMQNMRKYSRKKGYIPPYQPRGRAGNA